MALRRAAQAGLSRLASPATSASSADIDKASRCISSLSSSLLTAHSSPDAPSPPSPSVSASSSPASSPTCPPPDSPTPPLAPPDMPHLDRYTTLHAPVSVEPHASVSQHVCVPLDSHVCAASAWEDGVFAALFSPPQVAAAALEAAHGATGLPWWASIPATTLALRCALLPLSLQAHAASGHLALAHTSVQLARRVAEAVAEAARDHKHQHQHQQQEGVAVAAGEGAGAEAGAGAGPGAGGDVKQREREAVASLGRLQLVRRVLGVQRAEGGLPGFGWYVANAGVQGSLAVALTLALRRMSDNLWPGLTSQGLPPFTDLTAPPLILSTLSTPFGTAGTMIPLGLALMYNSAVDRSAGGQSPGLHMAAKLLLLPLYCSALLQPHAVLAAWLAMGGATLGVQALAARRAAGGGGSMGTGSGGGGGTREGAGAAEAKGPGAEAAGGSTAVAADGQAPLEPLLLALSDAYAAAGSHVAARWCVLAALRRQPDNAEAHAKLLLLQHKAQQQQK